MKSWAKRYAIVSIGTFGVLPMSGGETVAQVESDFVWLQVMDADGGHADKVTVALTRGGDIYARYGAVNAGTCLDPQYWTCHTGWVHLGNPGSSTNFVWLGCPRTSGAVDRITVAVTQAGEIYGLPGGINSGYCSDGPHWECGGLGEWTLMGAVPGDMRDIVWFDIVPSESGALNEVVIAMARNGDIYSLGGGALSGLCWEPTGLGCGEWTYMGNVAEDIVGTPSSANTTDAAHILRNEPNPFPLSTTLRVRVDAEIMDARVLIFTAEGRQVRAIPMGNLLPIEISITWDGRDDAGKKLPSGVYFYQLVHSGGVSPARKAIMLK